MAVAERIAGQHGHVDFNTVPWVIYTSPEIAWVGKTEQQLQGRGRRLSRRQLSVRGQRRARAQWATRRASSRSLADAATDRILGMHVIGPLASELIAEGVVAMEFGAAERGSRANLPRASVAVRGDEGSGARGGRTDAQSLASTVRPDDRTTSGR